MYCVVLELNDDKVWVARTRNAEQYVKYIEEGSQPQWVKKYGYKSVLEVSSEDSLKVTLKYMSSHGIENVRGFHHPTDKLSEKQVNEIKEAIEKLSEREKALEHLRSTASKGSSPNVLHSVSPDKEPKVSEEVPSLEEVSFHSDGVSDEDSDISTEGVVNYLLEQIEGHIQETLNTLDNTYQSSNSGEDNELSQKDEDDNVPEEKDPSMSSKIPNYIQVMGRVLGGMLDNCDKSTR